MKCYRQTCIALITLVAGLAMPLGLAAQDATTQAKTAQHHHYKLIDIGTFGGPQSYLNDGGFGFRVSLVNRSGQVVGWADTSQPDPFPQFCFDPDCFTAHALLWQDGERNDLGLLPGGASSQANWISSNGLVAGLAENGQIDPLLGSPELRAVLWQNGAITDLGTLEGGYSSIANAVNKEAQVVGVFANDVPDQNSMFGNGYQARAFLWQHGVMQDLGTLGGGTDAQALLINDRGQVVGWSYTGSPGNCGVPLATDSFIWEEGKGMTDLGNLGGTCTLARNVNNHGQVVGFSDVAGDIIYRPFIWSKGTMYDLGGSLGGTSGAANATNERGEVVGGLTLPGDLLGHAVLWKEIGKFTDLGALPGHASSSSGEAINSKEQVVGTNAFDVGFAGFLWENGSIVDLNTLVSHESQLTLQFALDINDRGEIAGNGVDGNGNEHALMLIPCDDDHPNLEGCDYSLVEGSTATTAVTQAPATKIASPLVQGNPAFSVVGNPMLRRFGPRFGAWYRGMGTKPNSTATPGIPPSASKATLSEPLLDESRENQILPPQSCVPGPDAGADSNSFHVHGLCDVGWTHRLNGVCLGHIDLLCAGKYVPAQCPVGAKPKNQVQGVCKPYPVLLDEGRPCVF